jgi:hypothetical protein
MKCYAYTDESGNSGLKLFGDAQDTCWTGNLLAAVRDRVKDFPYDARSIQIACQRISHVPLEHHNMFFAGNNGNSGNSRMNTGVFVFSRARSNWERREQIRAATCICSHFRGQGERTGNAGIRANIHCSRRSHCSRPISRLTEFFKFEPHGSTPAPEVRTLNALR